jgi:hypothetical protein
MKEIPILYSTPMIQAKLAGRKTQTRRLVKYPIADRPAGYAYAQVAIVDGSAHFTWKDFPEHKGVFIKCPYGQPGDLLWARETWTLLDTTRTVIYTRSKGFSEKPKVMYRADGDVKGFKWKPSIHMPKFAARIWDRVVSIRVERLQDITEDDAIAEGIEELLQSRAQRAENGRMFRDYSKKPEMFNDGLSAVKSYQSLWTKINGPGSWQNNEWVWVVVTENISINGRP